MSNGSASTAPTGLVASFRRYSPCLTRPILSVDVYSECLEKITALCVRLRLLAFFRKQLNALKRVSKEF